MGEMKAMLVIIAAITKSCTENKNTLLMQKRITVQVEKRQNHVLQHANVVKEQTKEWDEVKEQNKCMLGKF